jgi:hypothetical protein
VLPLEHPDEIADLLDASGVDLDVPIPTVPGEAEPRILGGPAGQLDPRHHPVQVDPRPAFAELGRAVSGATRLELATAAAGVLAGRLASASRRWQEG